MKLDRRTLLTSGFAGIGLAVSSPSASLESPLPSSTKPDDTAEFIDLWPQGAPGQLNAALTETLKWSGNPPSKRFVTGVVRPRLSVYRPKVPNGGAMLILPGGGYGFVSIDNEGHEIARYLAAAGITAFYLTYRLPAEGWANASDVPLMDAQRGLRLIRHHAGKYGVDPARIGVMGFSAGGHLCASLATRYNALVYPAADTVDTLSARPNLFAPIYPVISMKSGVTHGGSKANLIGATADAAKVSLYSTEDQVTLDTPPAFIAHSEDDKTVPVENALLLRAALKASGVTVETHLFPEGGHGYGLNSAKAPWGPLFLRFAKDRGLIV